MIQPDWRRTRIPGTRVPFQALLDYLEGGQPLSEFPDDFPRSNLQGPCSFANSDEGPVG
jgi:uncharacterized protein (DUF433 family)